MDAQQLEITFALKPQSTGRRHGSRPVPSAPWWFARMKFVVRNALDLRPTPPARAQQTYLGLPSR